MKASYSAAFIEQALVKVQSREGGTIQLSAKNAYQ
jgi:hypothetical protein